MLFRLELDSFQQVETLQSIITVVVDVSTNPHKAVEVGTAIQEKMIWQNALWNSLKKMIEFK